MFVEGGGGEGSQETDLSISKCIPSVSVQRSPRRASRFSVGDQSPPA